MQGKVITCSECGQEKPDEGRGLCGACYQRERRRTHPGEDAAYARKYREEHPDRIKESRLRYNEQHREEARIRSLLWRQENRERHRSLARQWAEAHPEERRINLLRWLQENPERAREIRQVNGQRRIARKRLLPATLTVEQWTAILAAYKGKCAYCGKSGLKLTQDHVIPVSKGGGYEIGNIVPACQPCNRRKGTKPPPKPIQTLLL